MKTMDRKLSIKDMTRIDTIKDILGRIYMFDGSELSIRVAGIESELCKLVEDFTEGDKDE